MTVTFGFYNSVGGDRVYDATQISQMFNGILTDGVFKLIGNKFQVVPNTGMGILVKSGKAWFNNTWLYNDGDIALTVPNSHLVLPRIDSVIIEIDAAVESRTNSIKILTGVPNASPVPITLTHTAELNQYPIAYISVGNGVSSINSGDITGLVGTIDCPYIVFPEPAPDPTTAVDVLKVQIFT